MCHSLCKIRCLCKSKSHDSNESMISCEHQLDKCCIFCEQTYCTQCSNADHLNNTESKDDLLERLAKKILKGKIDLNREIMLDFLLQNPGICTDYLTNEEVYCYRCDKPYRNLAPCIIKKMPIQPPGVYKYGTRQRYDYLKTNILDYYSIPGFKILEDKKIIYVDCPDGKVGCEVLHHCVEITYTEKQNALRQKYNEIELKYNDLLKLWQPIYDYHMNNQVEKKYKKWFACKLKAKHWDLTLKEEELKILLETEINMIMTANRRNPEYYKD